MQFNFDDLTADELEEYAKEVYESAAQRNQYPQEFTDAETPVIGETVVKNVAEYTMIPPPSIEEESDLVTNNGS